MYPPRNMDVANTPAARVFLNMVKCDRSRRLLSMTIKSSIYAGCFFMLLSSGASYANTAPSTATIQAQMKASLLKMTHTTWHKASFNKAPFPKAQLTLIDFLPEGQSILYWTSLLQYRVFFKSAYTAMTHIKSINAAQYVAMAKKTLTKRCSSMQWKTIYANQNKAMYQYQIQHCGGWGTQYRIAKVVNLAAGTSTMRELSYTQRQLVSKKDQKQYLALINSIPIGWCSCIKTKNKGMYIKVISSAHDVFLRKKWHWRCAKILFLKPHSSNKSVNPR